MNLSALLVASLLIPAAEPAKNPFLFNEGDRVVFLGGTLIEREQKYGYWELALTLLNKDKNVTFRNLGWSGDTVWCESRGSFDGPKKGFENTIALGKELKPTVIVLCYGQVESFDGEAGVKKFTEGYEKLIDALTPTKARIVLMTPSAFEKNLLLKDVVNRNKDLELYGKATLAIAEKRSLGLFDFLHYSQIGFDLDRTPVRLPEVGGSKLSDNGVHYNAYGYAITTEWLVTQEISMSPPKSGFESTPTTQEIERVQLKEQLRNAIIAKNRLYFDRWRPQNQTYLFGFRKKEQGQNAKEIAEFDPLIEKAEKEIAELRKKLK
jgi:hypothetical protein